MSLFVYEEFVKEYIGRTQDNLKIVDCAEMCLCRHIKSDIGLFLSREKVKPQEITQLINSLFGILVLPYEHFHHIIYKNNYPKENIIHHPGYQDILEIIKEAERNNRLCCTSIETHPDWPVRNFLTHMRNALAHSGNKKLYFDNGVKDDEIEEVYFADFSNKTKSFCAKFNIGMLRRFKNSVAEFFSSIDTVKSDKEKERKANAYKRMKEQMDNFLISGGKSGELSY